MTKMFSYLVIRKAEIDGYVRDVYSVRRKRCLVCQLQEDRIGSNQIIVYIFVCKGYFFRRVVCLIFFEPCCLFDLKIQS